MPRDFGKPPRGDKPQRGGHKSGGFSKPWEKRERPQGGARGFGAPKRGGGEARDFHVPRYDDELFTAHGKVADIVGPGPQSRFDMLRKLWDFFRAEDLITASGNRRIPKASDWRHSDHEEDEGEERPVKRVARKPAGKHPSAVKARQLEGVPRRKFKETRET